MYGIFNSLNDGLIEDGYFISAAAIKVASTKYANHADGVYVARQRAPATCTAPEGDALYRTYNHDGLRPVRSHR